MKTVLIVLFILALITAAIFLATNESFWTSPMPILVISIPKSNRRRHMQDLLHSYSGQVKFLDGIIAMDDDAKGFHMRELGLPENLETVKRGELGCALAHMYAYKYIMDNNLKRAVILEDDVVLEDEDALQKIAEYQPPSDRPEAHVVWLHGVDGMGTQAQIVSLDGARFLFDHRDIVLRAPIDMAIWNRDVPVVHEKGPVLFKHRFEFNDINTSERIQLDQQGAFSTSVG